MEYQITRSSIEKLYRAKVTLFERPLTSNHGYNYKVVHAVNPRDFMITIQDEVGLRYGELLPKALKTYSQELMTIDKTTLMIDSNLFYVGMPVLIKASSFGSSLGVSRGEVLEVRGNELAVLRVDIGGVVSIQKEDALPITLSVLRIPKLGVPCLLAQIQPDSGNAWPERDYVKDFTGNESQTVTFLDYYPATRSYEVVLDVDRVNVGLKYFHKAVASPIQPSRFTKDDTVKGFPVSDYSPWIGLKVIAFGIKVIDDTSENRITKCVLQLEPETVNYIQERISSHVDSMPDAEKKIPFAKTVGTPCLALYGEEFFRAIITKCNGSETYSVDFVDYGEQALVSASNILKLPQDLLQYPEGAVVCQITDLLSCDFRDGEKLKALVENQDLYAVIDACDPEVFGPELLVSLFKPDADFSGSDKSIGEILNINERPPVVKEFLQVMEWIPKNWGEIFMKSLLPDQNILFPGVTISAINSWDSIWLHFGEKCDDFNAAISAELALFYENGGCDTDEKENCLRQNLVGRYVATKMSEEDDLWYRAKVLKEQGNLLTIVYVDYGNVEEVNKDAVYPLHKYFAKDPLVAVEVKIL